MASFNNYNQFVEDIGRKVHNLNADTLKIALTNTAPNAATHKVLADITEISSGNGYSAGGATVGSTSYAQSSGTAKLAGNDVTITASGGSVGPFRYAVLYNATVSGGALIGWWDRGTSVTLSDGDQFVQDFSDNTDIIQIS